MSTNRLHQYKNGARKTTLLKDVLMKKCIEEMKTTRRNLHNSRRNLDKFEEEEANKAIRSVIDSQMGQYSTDERIQMFETLREDLLQIEYEDWLNVLQEEEASLLAHLEEDVFCPICQVNPMNVDHTGMICTACNFAHRASIQISKEELANRFRQAFCNHADSGCQSVAVARGMGEKLFIGCDTCLYQHEVL